MTELEKKVKELRDKYEGPIRKYYDAKKVLHAETYEREVESSRFWKLAELYDRLFPLDVIIAARCAILAMDCLDREEDYPLWGPAVIEKIEMWKNGMDKIEI